MAGFPSAGLAVGTNQGVASPSYRPPNSSSLAAAQLQSALQGTDPTDPMGLKKKKAKQSAAANDIIGQGYDPTKPASSNGVPFPGTKSLVGQLLNGIVAGKIPWGQAK